MESDGEIQAFCNQCGGQLQLIPADINKGRPVVTYKCARCGGTPLELVPRPTEQRIAHSYNVTPKLED